MKTVIVVVESPSLQVVLGPAIESGLETEGMECKVLTFNHPIEAKRGWKQSADLVILEFRDRVYPHWLSWAKELETHFQSKLAVISLHDELRQLVEVTLGATFLVTPDYSIKDIATLLKESAAQELGNG